MNIYEGRVFRPPSEASSLIIQATIGCSHNKCKFCTMYNEKTFRLKSAEEVINDIKKLGSNVNFYNRLFLADGDAMSLPTEELLKILDFIEKELPNINRIGIYSHGNNLLNKSLEELVKLKENGISIVYIGLESGSEDILKYMNKGISVEDTIKGTIRAKEAGLKTSVMLISGLGGREMMREHALESAKAVNRIKPNYLSLLTLMLDEEAGIMEDISSGSFELLTPQEVLEEARMFIEETDLEKTLFRSNHASNYVALGGTLGRDKNSLLEEINTALSKKVFKNERHRGL